MKARKYLPALASLLFTIFWAWVIGVSLRECGWKAFLLGDGAFFAAITGMCS